MAILTDTIFRRAVPPETFRRGRRYVADGAVEQVTIERKGSGVLVSGIVYGSVRYHTSLTVNADGTELVGYDCDCPAAMRGACKHVVALGLVAARRSAVSGRKKPAADADLVDFLRAHAKERGASVDEKELHALAGKMSQLSVARGAGSLDVPRAKPRVYDFDHVVFSFDYDRANDRIRVRATAHYGPVSFSLLNVQPATDALTSVHADRDWSAERDASLALRRSGFSLSAEPGTYAMPAAEAFGFLRDRLPTLRDAYEVETTEAFDDLAHPQKVSVESDWSFGDGAKENWFSFSVDWKAGGRELTAEEIWRLAHGLDTHVRTADGAFLEIENTDAMRRYLRAVDDVGLAGQKRHAVPLARALELQMLAEETAGARVAETESAVGAFLRDAKEGKLLVAPKVPAALANILRPYQHDAVAWALFLRRYGFAGVLADDMGLGKTLQALTILSAERPPNAGPSLVICPKTVVSSWIDEARRFAPDLRVVSVEGTVAERERLLKNAGKTDLLVTSYALFQRDAKRYRDIELYYAMLDEAQYVKNPKSATAAAVKTIRAKHRLALTGTPLENGVHELWSLFDFLMPGLLGDQAAFRAEFERPIRDAADADALARLKRRVKPFLLRRTKETVAPELPPRVEQTGWCTLVPSQAALYADVLASVRKDVFEAVERKGFARARIEILTALTRLRQVCDHPALIQKGIDRSEEHSGKMAHALELVREAAEGGHKVLLFSQFTTMLDILRDGLDRIGVGHETIEGKTLKRAEVVERFRRDPNVSVFLLSLRAAGTGLTLTEADTVILYDPWWNPMVERQAMDRAHRIGQTKSVNVHKLACRGTIEERVLALQERKKAVFDAVVSDSAEGMKGLTWEDVQSLFD